MLEIPCLVELIPVVGHGGRSSATRACIRIGKEGAHQTALVNSLAARLSMLICTQANKTGRRLTLEGNVERVFNGHVDQGKATIRLRSPPVDVCIREAADVDALRAALHMIDRTPTAAPAKKRLTTPAIATRTPAHTSAVTTAKRAPFATTTTPPPQQLSAPSSSALQQKLQTRLTVDSTALPAELPPHLQQLTVLNTRMLRLDARILTISKLSSLDLTGVQLTTLPPSIATLTQLTVLRLRDNRLEKLPARLTSMRSLAVLDVRRNRLATLPPALFLLARLTELNVSHNLPLTALPDRLHHLKQLRTLDISHCSLAALPAELLQMQLTSLELSHNQFDHHTQLNHYNASDFPPTLQELCARKLVQMRFDPRALQVSFSLNDLFARGRACTVCAQVYLDAFIHFTESALATRIAAQLSYAADGWGPRAPFLHRFCSPQCAQKCSAWRRRNDL